MPNLLKRFAAHKKALAANLFAGTARRHRGNIAASIMTEMIYAMPVLYSGLASLMLTRTEVNLVDQHYINTLRNILKAHNGTPHPFVLFLAGSLPGKAILHLRQLSLFSMISRLPQDPLFTRAKLVLTSAPPSWKSWFTEIRDICLLYKLPHPLSLLENPLSKDRFKKMAKSLVTDYWEKKLRRDAAPLPSLAYFKPELETLEHILVFCQYYDETRAKLHRLWTSTSNLHVLQLLSAALNGPPLDLVQFILDASVHPSVIYLTQSYGPELLFTIFHLTRTWCFSIHRERAKLQGRFGFD